MYITEILFSGNYTLILIAKWCPIYDQNSSMMNKFQNLIVVPPQSIITPHVFLDVYFGDVRDHQNKTEEVTKSMEPTFFTIYRAWRWLLTATLKLHKGAIDIQFDDGETSKTPATISLQNLFNLFIKSSSQAIWISSLCSWRIGHSWAMWWSTCSHQ